MKTLNNHEFISLGYNFYIVHAGTTTFFEKYADEMLERLDDRVTTFDLLRALQTFSEIGKRFPKIFIQLERLFLKRY